MKPILVFDVETTGLPQWKLPSLDPSQPRIIEIAAELVDEENGNVLGAMDLLIRPDGWTIPPEIEALTGITNDQAEKFGVPIAQAMDVFMSLWLAATLRVAHNEPFDARMVRIELARAMAEDDAVHEMWKNGAKFCTQSHSTKALKIGKTVNLREAYQHFTGEELVGAHRAATDVHGCKTVYFGLKRQTTIN